MEGFADISNDISLCYTYVATIIDKKMEQLQFYSNDRDQTIDAELRKNSQFILRDRDIYKISSNSEYIKRDSFDINVPLSGFIDKLQVVQPKLLCYSNAKIKNADEFAMKIENEDLDYDLYFPKHRAVIAYPEFELYYVYNIAKNKVDFNSIREKFMTFDDCMFSSNYDDREFNMFFGSEAQATYKNICRDNLVGNLVIDNCPTYISFKMLDEPDDVHSFDITYDEYGLMTSLMEDEEDSRSVYYTYNTSEDYTIIRSIHPHMFDIFDPIYNDYPYTLWAVDTIVNSNGNIKFERKVFQINTLIFEFEDVIEVLKTKTDYPQIKEF